MAEPSKELIKALNAMRDEFMRLHGAFYAGTLGEAEQAELAKHCNNMIEQTSHIGKGTVRPPSQAVYTRVDELDPDERIYIERIRSMAGGATPKKIWLGNEYNYKQDNIGKGKIVKEGDKI